MKLKQSSKHRIIKTMVMMMNWTDHLNHG